MPRENDGQRRSLNTMFRLGLDFSPKRLFKATIVSRQKPVVGLGGPWQQEKLDVYGRDEHHARRMLLSVYLADGRIVKGIDIQSTNEFW